MRYVSTLCAVAAVAAVMTACNQATGNRDADMKAIQDTELQWNQDFASKDLDKLVAHYEDNATLILPAMPANSGKDAIRAVMKGMVSDPALSLKFHASKVEVAKSGDLGYTQGSYTLTMTNPQTHQVEADHGSYVTTYRKQPDGTWKATVDSIISEVPPPAPAPETAAKH